MVHNLNVDNLSVEKKSKLHKLKVTDDVKIKGELDVHKFDTDRVDIIPNTNYVKVVFNQSNKIGNLVNLNLSLYFTDDLPPFVQGINNPILLSIANIKCRHNYPVNAVAVQAINMGETTGFFGYTNDTIDADYILYTDLSYGYLPVIIKQDGTINISRTISSYIGIYSYDTISTSMLTNKFINIVVTYAVGSKSDINTTGLNSFIPDNQTPFRKGNTNNAQRRQKNQERKEKQEQKRVSNLLKTIENSPTLRDALKKMLNDKSPESPESPESQ
jgi:hypothetical protein